MTSSCGRDSTTRPPSITSTRWDSSSASRRSWVTMIADRSASTCRSTRRSRGRRRRPGRPTVRRAAAAVGQWREHGRSPPVAPDRRQLDGLPGGQLDGLDLFSHPLCVWARSRPSADLGQCASRSRTLRWGDSNGSWASNATLGSTAPTIVTRRDRGRKGFVRRPRRAPRSAAAHRPRSTAEWTCRRLSVRAARLAPRVEPEVDVEVPGGERGPHGPSRSVRLSLGVPTTTIATATSTSDNATAASASDSRRCR